MSDWTVDQQSELAVRIFSGDRSAEDELVHLFAPKAMAMLVARTQDREASRDLLQEAMLSVIVALRAGQLRDPGKIAAFIHGITRNSLYTYLRRRSHERLETPLVSDSAWIAPVDLENGERETQVRRSLNQLESMDREILLRTLVNGEKPSAIADALGLSAEVVRQRKSRAIKKVTEYVQSLSRIAH